MLHRNGPFGRNLIGAALGGLIAILCLVSFGCGSPERALAEPLPTPTPIAPAITVQNSRDATITGDFLRFLYVPPIYPPPTKLGTSAKKRVFFQASQFLAPPLTVGQDISFPGLADSSDQILYALRCQPTPGTGVDPILATWPNVFQAVLEDFGGQGFTCPAPSDASPENVAYCLAVKFKDSSQQYADAAILNALTAGMQLFAILVPYPPPSTSSSPFPSYYYGAYPPFTGLGYAVNGSGDNHLLSVADISRNMIVPEYLLKNVTLGQANCHCIGLAPTTDPNTRLSASLDIDLIWKEGSPNCPVVPLP